MSRKPVSNATIITRRRNAVLDARGYAELIFRIAALILGVWLLLTEFFLVRQVSGNEMFPAVKDGDLVIAFRLQADYAKDDVVVYELDGEIRVGRIAARETDTVTLSDSGIMLVNGTTQSGEIIYPTYAKEGMEYPYTVPQGHVFILGDYRTTATDSRDFGPVPMSDLKGKVITILRRRGL